MELSERQRRILKAIIESYIDTAEPVGSKSLAVSFDSPISSATIRNEMSELEERGLLEKPHVSAGRVPSYAAYRLYVNELMERHRTAYSELEQIRRRMQDIMREMDDIMVSAARVVSEMTNYTSVSVLNRRGGGRVKKCELIAMDEGWSYAVVLVGEREVRHKLLHLTAPVEPSMAAMLSTAVNLAIAEGRLEYLLPSMLHGIGAQSGMYMLIKGVIDFIRQTENASDVAEVYVSDTARLLDNREYQDIQRMRELLDYMSDRSNVRDMVSRGAPERINIRIGPELDEPSMRDVSLVFTTYAVDRDTKGIIGIVAPTRMDYAAACAKLAAFAKAVSGMNELGEKIKDTGEDDEYRNGKPGGEA
ncbi:MAG: heat-inducible transcription repressor HrcA [Clostridia bacterium]|nr:heat-inducible transcription repressor HrcA [Clostridia bacterium]